MADTEILVLSPEFGLEETMTFNTNITESESGKERRDSLWDAGLREYKLTCRFLSKANMDLIWNFFIARKGAYDHFLVKYETSQDADAENVGTANGATTQFLLHNFPVDTADNHSCTVNGVANSSYTLSNNFVTEKSYITFDSPPAAGTILATYDYYFKVRFKDDSLTRQLAAYQLLHTGMTLKEVRWNDYVPIDGNSSSSSSSSSSSRSSSSSSSSSRSSSSSSSSSSSMSSSSSSQSA